MFEQFPYTNFHEMNLDWLLRSVKELGADVQEVKNNLANLPESGTNYNFLYPDLYEGSDAEKLQACINAVGNDETDEAVRQKIGVILINRDMTLDKDIQIAKKSSGMYGLLYVVGIGKTNSITVNTGCAIHGPRYNEPTNNTKNWGGVHFVNINFIGSDAETEDNMCFEADWLIRMFFYRLHIYTVLQCY